jgi:hypothetical protein
LKFSLLFFLLSLFFSILPNDSISYQEELIHKSISLKLSEKKRWILLIHYRKDLFGNLISDIQPFNFFRSVNGRTNPQAELEETIKSFFNEISFGTESDNGRCYYPARFKYLKQELNIDESKLPKINCIRLNEWYETLKPNGLSAVFSSYYMGNPSSMFGHNLYKIHSKGNEENEILDYGVNYAASGEYSGQFEYIYKGLFGLFPGTFSLFPYYLKTNEYNDLDLRDIWEYKLNLTEDEIDWYILHLWEMRLAVFRYYFFTKNCAYMLLPALEVAKPELNLSSKASTWIAPPPDSIRFYNEEKNLVLTRKYRPSIYIKIMQKLNSMNDQQRDEIYEIIKTKNLSKVNDLKPIQYDTLLDYYQMLSFRGDSGESEKEFYKIILKKRSQVEGEYSLKEPLEWSTPAEYSHKPSRIGVSRGKNQIGNFTELRYRFAYHDIMNQDTGHAPNSEVSFLNFNIRHYDESKLLKLDKFTLLKLISYSPYNPITKTKSYLVDIGIDSSFIKLERQSEKNNFLLSLPNFNPLFHAIWYNNLYNSQDIKNINPVNIEVALGATFVNEFNKNLKNLSIGLLGGFKTQFHSFFHNGYRYSPTLLFNMIYRIGNWKFLAGANYYYYQVSSNKNDFLLSLKIRYSINQDSEIRIENNSQLNNNELILSYNYFF